MIRTSIVLAGLTALFALLPPALAEDPQRFPVVETRGSGDTTLILVPCLGCDWRSWEPFMDAQGERYTMYAVDWPGVGEHDLPPVTPDPAGTPYADAMLRRIETLIQEKRLRKPVLVGHSAACPLVARAAFELGGLLSAAVTVDGVISNGDTLGFSRAERLAWADEEMKGVRASYDNDEAWARLNRAPSPIPKEILESSTITPMSDARRALYGAMWQSKPREHVLTHWRDWLATDAGALLPRVEIPLLAIFAARPGADAEALRAEKVERFRRNSASASVHVVFVRDTHHTIWEYQPDAFAAALHDFLTGRPVEPVYGSLARE